MTKKEAMRMVLSEIPRVDLADMVFVLILQRTPTLFEEGDGWLIAKVTGLVGEMERRVKQLADPPPSEKGG